jgi:hypothetical protein
MSTKIDVVNNSVARVLVDGVVRYEIAAETCITRDEYNNLMKLLNRVLQLYEKERGGE